MNRLRGYKFPLLMCLLTVATAGLYVHTAGTVGEYNFLVRADGVAAMRMRADLEGLDLHEVETSEVDGGLFRVTVRCPRGKLGAMLGVIGSYSDGGKVE